MKRGDKDKTMKYSYSTLVDVWALQRTWNSELKEMVGLKYGKRNV